MGHYNYHASKFKIKKETPPEVMGILNSLFAHDPDYEEFIKDPSNDVLIDRNSTVYNYREFWRFFQGNSVGMSCNGWRVKEDMGDHWLFESRSNCKYQSGMDISICEFFSKLKPWLIAEEGDILHRQIFESANRETLFCIKDGEVQIDTKSGCRYEVDYEYVLDDRHPVRHEDLSDDINMSPLGRGRNNPSNWMPPWTVKELAPINEEFEKNKRGQADSHWGF
jgi:hypothetical protein